MTKTLGMATGESPTTREIKPLRAYSVTRPVTMEVVRVGVYGTLRRGQSADIALFAQAPANDPFIVYLGKTTIKGRMTTIQGVFPYVELDPNAGDVVIEVYEVPALVVENILDPYEGYPMHYDRSLVDTEFGEVWVYHRERISHPRAIEIPDGDWVAYVNKRAEEGSNGK